jgi:circadian clock protein KaiB
MTAASKPHDTAVVPAGEAHYDLTLFVGGASDLSGQAIAHARDLCDLHLAGRHRLSVVDLHVDPDAGVRSRVHAAPTLVRNRPLPARKLVGDLSQTADVLRALGLPVVAAAADSAG